MAFVGVLGLFTALFSIVNNCLLYYTFVTSRTLSKLLTDHFFPTIELSISLADPTYGWNEFQAMNKSWRRQKTGIVESKTVEKKIEFRQTQIVLGLPRSDFRRSLESSIA